MEVLTNSQSNDKGSCNPEENTTDGSDELIIERAFESLLCKLNIHSCVHRIDPIEQKRIEHEQEDTEANTIDKIICDASSICCVHLQNEPDEPHCQTKP